MLCRNCSHAEHDGFCGGSCYCFTVGKPPDYEALYRRLRDRFFESHPYQIEESP